MFSGQTLYDSYLYQLFNMFYASKDFFNKDLSYAIILGMPIVVYATLDQEFSDKTLVNNPYLYT